MTEMTAVITFHREGALAIPALASLSDLLRKASEARLRAETLAVLDCPDEDTRHIVRSQGIWLDDIIEVTFGDLGSSRNAGAHHAKGDYVAFLDGDDLWGAHWLSSAYDTASKAHHPDDVIWHPERLFHFDESDLKYHSLTDRPNAGARSFHTLQVSSDGRPIDLRGLLVENHWSANAFAKRDIYLKFPYRAVDRTAGFGIEDWSWHVETLLAGFRHIVVPETVHLIRLKRSGSLMSRCVAEGLLPFLPADAFKLVELNVQPIPATRNE